MLRVDLHLHSWVSDGELSPAEVVRQAARAGLGVIAVTDHDTAQGVVEAREEGERAGVEVIPGIEISTRVGEHELHILGYGIDPSAPSIVEHQTRAVRRRADRMQTMVERLQGLGLEISMADVEVAAGEGTKALGRPHLARALFARGHTRYYSEAFVRFIGDGGPAFVAEGFPSPADAVDAIHSAGGRAVWAHPPLDWFAEGLPGLVQSGLDGVECYRPGTGPTDVAILESGARSYDLFVTGGSDWHGPHRGPIGEFWVDGERLANALELFGGRG